MKMHTPTPWIAERDDFGDFTIRREDAPLAIAAVVNGEFNRMGGRQAEHEANAAFLVRAVNSHDEAIEWIRATLNMVDGDGRPPNWDGMRDFLKRAAS